MERSCSMQSGRRLGRSSRPRAQRRGARIRLSVREGCIDLLVEEDELTRRRAAVGYQADARERMRTSPIPTSMLYELAVF